MYYHKKYNKNKMRLNTIDNEKIIPRKNINQKLSFPNIFNLTKSSHCNNLLNISSQKNISFRKEKNHHSLRHSNYFHNNKQLRNEINFVHMLNIEEKVSNIIKTDLTLKKQKLKIDNNTSLKRFRLGIYRKKEEEENNENNKSNNEKISNNKTLEKEKDNAENIEKIEKDLKDMEKMLEKKLEVKKEQINKIKEEYKNINDQLNKINEEIDENKMDEKILIDYAEEFDNEYENNLNAKWEEENNEMMYENNLLNYQQYNTHNKNGNSFNDLNKKRQKEMEIMNKMKAFRQKREDKKETLREQILQKQQMKLKLESELINKRNILEKLKEELSSIRNDLINRYHLKLYEGISFHNEGLPSIIKEIWKLDAQVNTNFMPSYLDPKSIQYLFQKARQSIEINRLRQVIKEEENDFILNTKDLKNDEGFINLFTEKKKNKFFNFNKKDERKNTPLDESELFKTKISDLSISYLDPYPKTKQFIIDYKKIHPQKFKKEIPKVDFKSLKFRSINIPNKITEKNKKIERLKFFLEIKLEQSRTNDRKEVERLNKEFITNNYQEKYNISVENLFGALFGDKRNEMLIYYARLEKDFKDNSKIIQFHSKYNSIKLK